MKAGIALLCGIVGGLAGGLLVHFLHEPATAGRARPAVASGSEPSRPRPERRPVVESRPAPSPANDLAEAEETAAPEEPAAAEANPTAGAEELDALVTVTMDNVAASRLFNWLSRNNAAIPGAIERIRALLEKDPGNAELHTALATAYVAQLANNTVDGPQRGLVWMQAAKAYDAAIALESGHWQARYGKAIGTTFIPPQFGQQPFAIKQFEELLELQRGTKPEPHYVQTYFQLGSLYKDMGNADKAREIWNEGARLFPDNETLSTALEVSTKR